MKLKSLFTLCISLLGLSAVFGQGVGTWTSHLAYQNGQLVSASGNKIFCSGVNSLAYFDKDDNSKNKLTLEDNLSGLNVSALNYDPATQQTIVAYKNGGIDFINDDLQLRSLNDIRRSNSVVSSKAINNITVFGDFAYLATDFGIVVVNIPRFEVKESYRNISQTGNEISIKKVVIDPINRRIFNQNAEGISYANLEGSNLLNFSSWTYIRDSTGALQNSLDDIEFFDGQLFAIKARDAIYKYNFEDKEFTRTNFNVLNSNVNSFRASQNKLVTSYFNEILVYNPDGSDAVIASSVPKNDAVLDNKGHVWAASSRLGLISNYQNDINLSYAPNSPLLDDIFSFYSHDDVTLALTGGYNGSFAPGFSQNGFSTHQKGVWESYISANTNTFRFFDPVDAVYDRRFDRYFIASYVSGLIVWNGGDDFFKLTAEDSVGIPFHTIDVQTRITSVDFDADGFLWVSNHLTEGNPPLHRLNTSNNTWISYSPDSPEADFTLDFKIDNLDNKWLLCQGSSIVVYNEKTRNEKKLNSQAGKGALPSTGLNAIEVDRTGQIWVGTDKGVAVFADPENVFTNDFYEASLPIVDRRPLLQDEQVNAVAIDGANRKWFGTTNGAFLFDENGTESIVTFTTQNSPLPSNNILAISINEQTGDVYFGTENGIATFKGDATQPSPNFGNAKIFPNPVNPAFDGLVTISGLKENSIIKITDISGAMIFETSSNGGTATWNARTLDGKTAETGVYLVYSADPEFEESFIGKIAVVK